MRCGVRWRRRVRRGRRLDRVVLEPLRATPGADCRLARHEPLRQRGHRRPDASAGCSPGPESLREFLIALLISADVVGAGRQPSSGRARCTSGRATRHAGATMTPSAPDRRDMTIQRGGLALSGQMSVTAGRGGMNRRPHAQAVAGRSLAGAPSRLITRLVQHMLGRMAGERTEEFPRASGRRPDWVDDH